MMIETRDGRRTMSNKITELHDENFMLPPVGMDKLCGRFHAHIESFFVITEFSPRRRKQQRIFQQKRHNKTRNSQIS